LFSISAGWGDNSFLSTSSQGSSLRIFEYGEVIILAGLNLFGELVNEKYSYSKGDGGELENYYYS